MPLTMDRLSGHYYLSVVDCTEPHQIRQWSCSRKNDAQVCLPCFCPTPRQKQKLPCLVT